MKKLTLLLSILILSLLVVPSFVFADYTAPTDTLDIPQSYNCESVDGEFSPMVANPQLNPDEVDCGDPCVSYHSDGAATVDNPMLIECGDPCVSYHSDGAATVENPMLIGCDPCPVGYHFDGAATIENPMLIDCGDPCISYHFDGAATIESTMIVDCGDPCVAMYSDGSNLIDNPHFDYSPDCGDPCVASFTPSADLSRTIAFRVDDVQGTSFDGDQPAIPHDCHEPAPRPQPQEDEDKEDDRPADNDGDGTLDNEDNCPDVRNPDQTNSFGSEAGDACEETYTSNNEVLWGFVSEESVAFYGFCNDESICQFIGYVEPSQFHEQIANDDLEDAGIYDDVLDGGKVLSIMEGEPTRMTVLFAIGTDESGDVIYQVNMYEMVERTENGQTTVFPYLVDDNFTILVDENGNWEWYDRIPN